jgi:hypothetical protein
VKHDSSIPPGTLPSYRIVQGPAPSPAEFVPYAETGLRGPPPGETSGNVPIIGRNGPLTAQRPPF